MKNLYFTMLFFWLYSTSFAQSLNDVGKIALSVVMPENVDGLEISQISKLETKIFQIVSSTGLSASGYDNNFVIYPKFAIYETNVVEGGMENITISTCELSLFIKQVDNNLIFSTISKQLKGSGKTKSTAITNAISKISTTDKEFKTFIETGKNKIITYYESKCIDIISKSEGLVNVQDFEQALGLLMTVPEEVSCYNKIQDKSIEAYKAFQNHKCKIQLQEAKTQLASNNYTGSLTILGQIDPSTICFKEADALMKNVAAKVDAEEKKQWDIKMKIYRDNVAMEKERIRAVKDIAVAYYRSRPTKVSYNYIIR